MIYLILPSETMEPLHDCGGQKLRAYFAHEYMSSKIDNPFPTFPSPIFVRARISLRFNRMGQTNKRQSSLQRILLKSV